MSLVERANLMTMRHRIRRLTRKTMGFSRKAQSHAHAVAVNFMAINFMMHHGALTEWYGKVTTLAMAAGLERRIWSMPEVAERMDGSYHAAA